MLFTLIIYYIQMRWQKRTRKINDITERARLITDIDQICFMVKYYT